MKVTSFSTELYNKVLVEYDSKSDKLIVSYHESFINTDGEMETCIHHVDEVDPKGEYPSISLRKVIAGKYESVTAIAFGYEEYYFGDSDCDYTGFGEPRLFKFSVDRVFETLNYTGKRSFFFRNEDKERYIEIAGRVFCFDPELFLVIREEF